MSQSCQQKIEAVLGRERRSGTRQILIESRDRGIWTIVAINNTLWPQPPELYATHNGWRTTRTWEDSFNNRPDAMKWYQQHKHLLPQSKADEQLLMSLYNQSQQQETERQQGTIKTILNQFNAQAAPFLRRSYTRLRTSLYALFRFLLECAKRYFRELKELR